ncbi:8-amino-7-oxononanoate synthase [Talaromyces pinophilus]|nr:8-amino-7-oxononanoate synthase [Talaromyces pinophilus]
MRPFQDDKDLVLVFSAQSQINREEMVYLLDSFQKALDKREARSARRRLTVLPTNAADFSSNDFLSLSSSSLLRSRFLHNLNASYCPSSNPSPSLGSGGSRLLDGNSAYAEELEKFIARFHDAPSGLLFNSGFDANVGVFSCLPQPGDIIVYDELIHASVHEGMRLSRAKKKIQFAHNSVSDLERVIQEIINDGSTSLQHEYNVFIAVETLYSMDGDTAPLEQITPLLQKYFPERNAYLIVDEAHATGVFGPNGAGVVQELGVEDQIFIRTHTFGKSLASQGAIVLCDPLTKEYLINYARTLIYTTAMSKPSLIAIRSAYELLAEGQTQLFQSNLQNNISYFQSHCDEMGHRIESSVLHIESNPRSPIFSFRAKLPRELARFCQEHGLIVRPIMAPTVPLGKERVRVCLHAGNTRQEMDKLLDTIEKWAAQQYHLVAKL